MRGKRTNTPTDTQQSSTARSNASQPTIKDILDQLQPLIESAGLTQAQEAR